MQLVLLARDQEIFAGQIVELRLPGSLRPFQVLKGHTPLISSLSAGKVGFTTIPSGERQSIAITRGFAHIEKEQVVVLVELA